MKTKNKLFSKFLLIIALIVLSSCEKDLYENQIQNSNNKREISFEQFKKETGLNDFKTKIAIPKNENTLASRNADGSYDLSDFNIDTNFIKRLVVNQKITYTFRIEPLVRTNESLFNLTMFYKNGWQSLILELKPTQENLILLKGELTEKFEGTITNLYQSNRYSSSPCTTIFIYFSHCTGTGQCASGTCDQCNLCVSNDSYTLCGTIETHPEPEHIDVGPSSGGGPGGDSSTTSDAITILPNLSTEGLTDTTGLASTSNQFLTNQFLNNLSPEQQQWTIEHPDEYNALINNLIANNWNQNLKNFIKQMINLCVTNNSTFSFDNSLNSSNAEVFANVQEFQNSIIKTGNGFDIQSTVLLNEVVSSVKFQINNIGTNLQIDVKQKLTPIYQVSSLTTQLVGIASFLNSTLTNYTVNNAPLGVIRIDVYDTVSMNLTIYGYGIVVNQPYHITILIDSTNGQIISSVINP